MTNDTTVVMMLSLPRWTRLAWLESEITIIAKPGLAYEPNVVEKVSNPAILSPRQTERKLSAPLSSSILSIWLCSSLDGDVQGSMMACNFWGAVLIGLAST